ncbi:hypothetical protein BDF21DRAFT_428157 [Thamnidium elegans]|nr:hypothetical protein BDF21DRAFT_393481 [Thamnidium elegans]KAI8046965.1 hypothetical protein BDF21DRAFT_435479 [Thamnidium elegans]KAI8064081.1 hypothetical protein BDF21DRAFT_428157 [Thamnidium elegans]
MEAIIPLLDNSYSYYIPSEEELQAMTKQLSCISRKVDHRKIYKADGVIRLHFWYNLEILLLETAGSLAKTDDRKASFDNAKGMFALLAMLNTVADKYHQAICFTFQKIKIYFLQAADKHIRLWSMQYHQMVCIILYAKQKLKSPKTFTRNRPPRTIYASSFTWSMLAWMRRCRYFRWFGKNMKKKIDSGTLSDIICSQLFSLTYNKDGEVHCHCDK